MADNSGERALRWGAERRLRFIELRLFWEGQLNRRDLRDAFAISDQQASADIALYLERAPSNCSYDRTAKKYVAEEPFEPVFGQLDAQTYLNELRSVSYQLTSRDDSWIGRFPDFDTVPYPKRAVDAATLRSFLHSIRSEDAIEIEYQSLSRPEPIWRWVTPHALGYDGHRWHARAFCHEHGDFRDFVLGRVLSLRDVQSHLVDPALDLAWSETIEFVIGTHPRLPEHQRRAVELDYRMVNGRTAVAVRAALALYLMRWLRVDIPAAAADPQKIQIVLLNKEQVEEQQASLNRSAKELIRKQAIPQLGASA